MNFYAVAVNLLRPLIKVFFRTTVIGRENEPDETYIMCANHSSFIDPVLCACNLKCQLRLVARGSLARFKIFDWIFKKVNVIKIDREHIDLSSMRTIISACKAGDCIGIFPQGTRMRRSEPKPEQAMSGAALIASQCKVKVLPISIVTKRRMPGFFRKTYIIIGKPITPEEYIGDGSRSKKEISEFIFKKVCEPFSVPFEDLKNYDKNR